jgi:hypothetical protein
MAGEIEGDEKIAGKRAPRPCLVCARVGRSYTGSAERYRILGDGADPLRALRRTTKCVRHTTAFKTDFARSEIDTVTPAHSTSVSLRSEGGRMNRLSEGAVL